MTIFARYAIRALLAALAGISQTAAAQETSLIVGLSHKTDSRALDKLKQDLSIGSTQSIPGIGSEVWRVPDGKLGEVFRRAQQSDAIESIDYTGEDYRSLFVAVPENMGLTAAQSAAVRAIEANPQLKDVQVVRVRAGDNAARLLTQIAGGSAGEESLLLNLQPGTNLALHRQAIDKAGGKPGNWASKAAKQAFEWMGVTPTRSEAPATGIPEGAATLVVRGDKILGSVTVGTESYSISPLSGGLHAIARIDSSAFPPDEPAEPAAAATEEESDDNDAPIPGSTGSYDLRIAIAYTPAVAQMMRTSQIDPEQVASYAIAKSNEGFENSGMKTRFVLAGVRQVVGAEPGDVATLVRALVGNGDGVFDAAHDLRKSTRANAVVLLVAERLYCGRAAGNHAGPAAMYVAVSYSCIDNFSVAHEIAHLLGARHDPDTDPKDQPFAYGHGYRLPTFRTIMAYPGGACGVCPRINRWADPHKQLNGVPLGTPDRNDDARMVEEMAPIYSGYFEP